VAQHTQLATSCDERYRQAVQRELAAFEKLENDFNARERRERAAKLGLVLDNCSLNEPSNHDKALSWWPQRNGLSATGRFKPYCP
jgi:hypothetical protein